MRTIQNISRNIAKIGKSIHISIITFFPDDKDFFVVREIYRKHGDSFEVNLNFPAFLSIKVSYEFTLVDKKYIDNTRYGHEIINITAGLKPGFIRILKSYIEYFESHIDEIFIFDTESKEIQVNYKLFENNRFEYVYKDYIIRFVPRLIDKDSSIKYTNILFEYAGDSKAIFTKVATVKFSDIKDLYEVVKDTDIFLYSQLLINFIGKKSKYYSNKDNNSRMEEFDAAFELAEKSLENRIKEKERLIQNEEKGTDIRTGS